MPYAIQVREDNLDYIDGFGRERQFNLDYLRDNMEFYLDFGENTYLITDGTVTNDNVTFTAMSESGFRDYWKFIEPEDPTKFVKIERV